MWPACPRVQLPKEEPGSWSGHAKPVQPHRSSWVVALRAVEAAPGLSGAGRFALAGSRTPPTTSSAADASGGFVHEANGAAGGPDVTDAEADVDAKAAAGVRTTANRATTTPSRARGRPRPA